MSNPNISLNSFIKTYDNVLTGQFCREVCQKMDNDNRKKLGVFKKGYEEKTDPSFKNSLDLKIAL